MDENQVSTLLGALPEGQPVQDLQTQPFADAARAGMVGFCYGGGVTWRVATKTPELPWHGSSNM